MQKTIVAIFAAAICGAAFGQAPGGYTRLAYIESSGTQYIDTGYKPSKNTRTVIDYQIAKSAIEGQERVFGVDNMTISYSLYVSGNTDNKLNYWAYAFKDGDGQWKNEEKNANTARHVFDFNNGGKLTVDGGSVWDTTLNATPSKTATGTLFLGARRVSSGASNITPHRIFACKMWGSGGPVRDYVPCAYEGVTGLWDRVEGKFYGSARSAPYAGAPFTAPALEVMSSTSPFSELGTPSPGYGLHENLSIGEGIEISCPAAVYTNASEDVITLCTGWKLYDADGTLVDQGDTHAFTCVYPPSVFYRKVEWQWEERYRIAATAAAGGTVSPAEQWVAPGATATVTATPAAGKPFYKWTNDVPASVSALSPSISFEVSAPVSLFATFGDILYVAEDGDDANGGTSWDDAFASLEKAHAIAPHGTIIHVGPGTYALTGKISMTNDVFIIGAGPDASMIDCANAGGQPFTISAKNARLEGLCIYNSPAVSGCIGGIKMSAGVVAGCTISNCVGKVSSGGAGGIYMTGGTVTNCLITRCQSTLSSSGYPQGSGIGQHGGLVTDCRFVANRGGGYQIGVGIYIDKGVCERCVFTGQTAGTPIHNAGGTVRNCLVYGNTTAGTPASFPQCKRFGGAYQSSGSLYNCTIVGNRTGTGVGGLQAEGGNVVNNIVWNNTSGDGTTVGYSYSGSGAFHTNLLDTATDAGVGNFSSDPCFVNAANGDYHLGRDSLAINAGAPLAGVTCDLDRTPRPFGPAPEIGCYEYTAVATELTCGIRALLTEYCEGVAFSLPCVVEGPDLAGLEYAWTLDGVACTPGTDPSEGNIPGTLEPGRHTVSLTVSNGAGDSASDSVVISILPLTVYVAEDGDDAANFPYHTAGHPAATFTAALAAVWKSSTTTSQVFLAEGTYTLGNPVTLALPVKIAGAGARTTTIDCSGIASRAFYMNHRDAEVRGLTVANAHPSVDGTSGSAFYIVDGTVDSCIVTNCIGYTLTGGGIYMTGGVVTNSLITRCRVERNTSGYNKGEGIYMTGGRVSGCTFIANNANSGYSNGYGLHMDTGGTVENCVFTDHSSTPLMFSAGTVRNCLIYGNRATATDHSNYRKTGGVYMSGGRLYNCTIVTNRNYSSTTGSAGLRMAGGRAVNNIVWGNPSADGTVGVTISSGSTFTTNLVDAAISSAGTEVGTVVSTWSPFKRPAANDYRLKTGSLAVGMGDNAIWNGVANPTDLDGNPRIIPRRNGVVDAGCFESQQPPATVLFLK